MPWQFHTGVSDTLAHIQRLLSKRSSPDDLWVIQGPEELLKALDAQLWTQPADSFLPHVKLSCSVDGTSRLVSRTRLWLAPLGMKGPQTEHTVKLRINLQAADLPAPVEGDASSGHGEDVEDGASRWDALHGVVVVGRGRPQVAMGRQLWKQAQEQGLNPQHRAFE